MVRPPHGITTRRSAAVTRRSPARGANSVKVPLRL